MRIGDSHIGIPYTYKEREQVVWVDGLNINQSNQLGYGIINVHEKHQWQSVGHYRDNIYSIKL